MPSDIAKPDYDRSGIRPGIVHIGIGAFHRGHMAVYIDSILSQDPHWGIVGASLRRPDTKTALEPQNFLYSVSCRDATGASTRIIGSVLDIVDASADTEPLVARMAEPQIRIYSMTVTEKGYCHDPASGRLSLHHPDIVHDLEHPRQPRSVPGLIVAAAEKRRAAGLGGVTVLSCDNLQANGRIARTTVIEFARQRDTTLAEWIDSNFSFPSTMVDRIVPAVSDKDRLDVSRQLHLEDAAPVLTEPFSQWVVEDRFAAGRPDLQSAGVQLVADVEPFELMKLRMLNGSHSTMAYLGQLAGHDLVSEAVKDSAISDLVHRLMTEEIIPTLDVPGIDLFHYRDQLLARFANPALQHRLAQIAMDGSQKLPQRILMPIRERLARGASIELLCLTLAGWIVFLERSLADDGQPLNDPLAPKLAAAVRNAGSAGQLVSGILAIEDVFGDDLLSNRLVLDTVERHVSQIRSHGVSTAIARTS